MTTSADFGQSLTPEELLVAQALADTDPFEESSMWAIGTEACDLVTRLHANGSHVCRGEGCPDPSHRVPLATEAHARISDPATSHAAATDREGLRSDQMAVLSVIENVLGHHPWTYDTLVKAYLGCAQGGTVRLLSPPGIRSRAKELHNGGWTRKAGTGRADTGRPAQLWELAR